MKKWMTKLERIFKIMFVAMAFTILPWSILHLLFISTSNEVFKMPDDPILFTFLWGICFFTLYRILNPKKTE